MFIPDERVFLLIGNDSYANRRKEEGYGGFSDLTAVNDDIANTKQGLLNIGVTEAEIKTEKNVNFQKFS